MKKIVLASSSRYRAELLSRVLPTFTVDAPEADEQARAQESPGNLAARLALLKARTVAARHPEALVIGSDQVAAVGSRIFGKPGQTEIAAATLREASGQEMVFHTAVAVIDTKTGRTAEALEAARARFRPLTDAEIEAYLRLDSPLDCAGAIRIESRGPMLLESLDGRDPTTMVGLPLIAVLELLRGFGVDPLTQG